MSPKAISGKRRTKAEVLEIKEAAREEAYQEYAKTGTGASLRRIHYRVHGRHDTTYRNTSSDYKSLSKWLAELRLEGGLPWWYIADSMRAAHGWVDYSNLGDYLDGVESGYGRDMWQDQPRYVEVWVEKNALSAVFSHVLGDYRTTYNVGRGFSSWSAVKETADRYRRIAKCGKEVTLLAFSDFDPSGEDMIRDLRERLGHPMLPGGGVHSEIVKCALHFDDVGRYNLPPDFTKAADSRAAEHVARHGDVAVELDALDVDVLMERLRSEVERRVDLEALERAKETERQERHHLRELIEDLRQGL